MVTNAAARTLHAEQASPTTVASIAELTSQGVTHAQIRAKVAALRWRRIGRAVVLHRGELTRPEGWAVALANCEPGSGLASFTALEAQGLRGWERDEIHLIASAGARRLPALGFPVRLHRSTGLSESTILSARRLQRFEYAALLAASSFRSLRPACGLLAAGVQQRLTTADALYAALLVSRRTRHRAALLGAVSDIAGGAHALSEIDFVRLCRRHGLPAPKQQSVRKEPGGRKRYLDAEWLRADGRRVVAEVDGAIHLAPARWFDDQFRKNEVTLSDSMVLRFPSFVIRAAETSAIDQLRRALLP